MWELEQRLAEQQRQLQSLQALTQDLWNECENERRAARMERAQSEQAAQDERAAIAHWKQQAEQVLKQRELELHEREEAVARDRAALKQLRDEITQAHRETLEMRLVTEQLWAQLAARCHPAELTRSLGRLRAQLADEHRLAFKSIEEQKSELSELLTRLTEQQARLRSQRTELQDWAVQRQTELARHADELACREADLEAKEARIEALRQSLADQRSALTRQAHELTATWLNKKGDAVVASPR
jgi:chromosome segregation ATPase